jgi:superfamily II DNA/RNA helicase
MLDMGFQPQVDELVAGIPNIQQTMFFSATLDGAVGKLAEKYTTDAETIENVAAPGAGGEIDHVMMATTSQTRVETLLSQLLDIPRDLTLVFVSTQRMAEGLKEHLRTFGLRTTAIHGGMKQRERLREYRHFKTGAVDVLIATDIFSRGMDNDRITHVINYDLPEDSDAYRHRVGRTGRAGRAGVAITLVEQGSQVAKMRQIIKDVGLPQSLIDKMRQPSLRHYEQVPVSARYTDPPELYGERHSTRNHRRALEQSGAPIATPDTRPIDFGRSLPQVPERPGMKKLMAGAKKQHTHVRPGAAGVGTIMGYNDDKGFGFIKPAAGGKEIFFHRSNVAGGKIGLKKGASVQFTLGRASDKGQRVESVKVVRGSRVK